VTRRSKGESYKVIAAALGIENPSTVQAAWRRAAHG